MKNHAHVKRMIASRKKKSLHSAVRPLAGVPRSHAIAQLEDHVPGLLFQLRLAPSGPLQFCFLSPACEDLLGQSPAALYEDATRFAAQIVDDDQPDWIARLRESAQTLGTLNWEGRIRIAAWQDIKWINVRATPRRAGEASAGVLVWSGLMTNITQSKLQAEEIRQSRAQLAALAAYAETARERERARMERDLHDDLGGNLSALKMMFSHLQKQLPQTPLLQERSDYLIRLIDRSIESIHRIAADLRPGILDAGLVAALEWLAQEQRQQAGVVCALHCAQQDIMMDPALATSLFRIAQEACNNIRKHAQATRIDLRLYQSGGELVLEVCDDGIGIPDQRRHDAHSFGLLGMSERMAALGGRFDLESCNGQGTTVRVTAPLDTC